MGWLSDLVGQDNINAFKKTGLAAIAAVEDTATDVGNGIARYSKQVQDYKAQNELDQRLGTAWYQDKEKAPGFYKGNIDLNARDVYYAKGEEGSGGYIQTEESFGYDIGDDVVVSLPAVINGQKPDRQAGIDEFLRTGKHLGVYSRRPNESNESFYGRFNRDGQDVHNRQASYYADRIPSNRPVEGPKTQFDSVMEPNGLEDTSFGMLPFAKTAKLVGKTGNRELPSLGKGMSEAAGRNFELSESARRLAKADTRSRFELQDVERDRMIAAVGKQRRVEQELMRRGNVPERYDNIPEHVPYSPDELSAIQIMADRKASSNRLFYGN